MTKLDEVAASLIPCSQRFPAPPLARHPMFVSF
jgi:hypothetical protein